MRETREARSSIMRAVKGRDTAPELVVRRLAHRMGYRFRVCQKDLPGCPDIVFPRLRKVIFVHGCFWHGHDCARGARIPKGNRAYWLRKVAGNAARDKRNLALLADLGWGALVVWECAIRDEGKLKQKVREFLEDTIALGRREE
jgi:DNA mismatch endonuclease (patch repair protein)